MLTKISLNVEWSNDKVAILFLFSYIACQTLSATQRLQKSTRKNVGKMKMKIVVYRIVGCKIIKSDLQCNRFWFLSWNHETKPSTKRKTNGIFQSHVVIRLELLTQIYELFIDFYLSSPMMSLSGFFTMTSYWKAISINASAFHLRRKILISTTLMERFLFMMMMVRIKFHRNLDSLT